MHPWTPFIEQVKLHTPPRLPRKTQHAVRHAAARAFRDLGLTGIARVDAWVVMRPGWELDEERARCGPGPWDLGTWDVGPWDLGTWDLGPWDLGTWDLGPWEPGIQGPGTWEPGI